MSDDPESFWRDLTVVVIVAMVLSLIDSQGDRAELLRARAQAYLAGQRDGQDSATCALALSGDVNSGPFATEQFKGQCKAFFRSKRTEKS